MLQVAAMVLIGYLWAFADMEVIAFAGAIMTLINVVKGASNVYR
jgi:hypothetical protein